MGSTVLIVEDDALLLRLMQLKLEQNGSMVTTATDGEMALMQIQNKMPDLVITELMLPKLDGFQLMRELHKLHGELPARFVVVSFRSGSDDRLMALNLGAVDFIAKPLSLDELVVRAELACATSQLDGKA